MKTPGPWIVSTSQHITMIYALNHPEENICEVVGNMENANLIAAAPELLEALKVCQTRLFLHDGSTCKEYRLAAEAITKAEGRGER